MAVDEILIRGARQHNLKNVDLVIPRNRLVVITGVSGSGKSSLAFDTIFAEGQRRYVESLSAYARQFLEQMEKPDVDLIDGLSPAVSIEQKTVSRNPRSTVGTVTEIYDYLRVLFAGIGKPHCHQCGRPIKSQTVQEIADRISSLPERTKVVILAPLVTNRKGEHQKLLDHLRREGFIRARINGEIKDLDGSIHLDKKKKHSIEAVVDRLVVSDKIQNRLADSLELALGLSGGTVIALILEENRDLFFSERAVCHQCGISYPDPTPAMFSFNSPMGACPECEGLGVKAEVDPELVVPDPSLSIREGAMEPWANKNSIFHRQRLAAIARHFDFDLDTPFQKLPSEVRQALLFGTGDRKIDFELEAGAQKYAYRSPIEGAVNRLKRKYLESDSSSVRMEIERFMNKRACEACGGARLKKESLGFLVGGMNIHQVTRLTIQGSLDTLDSWDLDAVDRKIARRVLKEIKDRLSFLMDVGLEYLTLDRSSETLSGGESQRIRLATQIGSRLAGVLYVLDEPSIGLHQRDNRRLLNSLIQMRDLGNTILVVEHDQETILTADHVVDMGPGAGLNGGEVVFNGHPEGLLQCENSLTGKYLSGKLEIPLPGTRREPKGALLIRGAEHHNLKSIDVDIPLGVFTCVTGVSGSGKSSLVVETLYPHLARQLYKSRETTGKVGEIRGIQRVDKVVDIDQSPIGRTPRSNPATYTGLFTFIRDLFAQVPESRARGYKPGRFSFNVKGGRCEACQGDGVIKIEMHFLPDVYVTCDVCKGKRYNRETLQITYKGKNIAQVLDMTVNQAARFFEAVPNIRRKLQTLQDVGMGYVKLGQPATTLSGGEAQRIKLSKELSKRDTGNTFYILDEPTTGLHFDDIRKLLEMLNRLVDKGNTVLVIEHNLDVIKSADYVIDLGPEGGDRGGYVVACGTPEEICRTPESYTGLFLKSVLSPHRKAANL